MAAVEHAAKLAAAAEALAETVEGEGEGSATTTRNTFRMISTR